MDINKFIYQRDVIGIVGMAVKNIKVDQEYKSKLEFNRYQYLLKIKV